MDRAHEMSRTSAEAWGCLAAGVLVRACAVGAVNAICHSVVVKLRLDQLWDNQLWDDRLWDLLLPTFAFVKVFASASISVLMSASDFMSGFASGSVLGAEA